MVTLISQLNITVKEMEKELEGLRNEFSFREYVGYEMALNRIRNRFEKKLIKINKNC